MDFKLALIQHPMYLLIREDSVCAERTPPWGAENIQAYIQRIRDNLKTLREHAWLKLGYEWSAHELELLSRDAPDVFEEMMEMVRSGRATLYNGTYSQPHLQTLSSESNYRQFELAAQVYRELCRHPVVTYAHQECSLNEQTPQLLRAFGIQWMPLPHFISTLVIEGGELAFHSKEGTMTLHGSEFAQWRGLDGTLLDVYLQEPQHLKLIDWIHLQEIKGLLHVPPILIEMPDMATVDERWLEKRTKVDFVNLDEELPRRKAQYPPRFQVRMYSNWSYLEGIRAEELSRSNFLAEQAALSAEALDAMAHVLTGRSSQSCLEIWKKILASQHHDVYCFCAPELKAKAIRSLKETREKCEAMIRSAAMQLMEQISSIDPAREQVVVFNPLPSPVKSPVSVRVGLKNPALVDSQGREVPLEVTPLGEGSSEIRFLVQPAGLGYASFEIGQRTVEGDRTCKVIEPYTFTNDTFQCVLGPDGTVLSLKLAPGGEELLDTTKIHGNQLAGQDHTGLGTRHDGIINIGPAVTGPFLTLEPALQGPELPWQLLGQAEIRESALGATFLAAGQLNEQISAGLQIKLYHDFPRIDFRWEFDFHQASVGSFFDDETKLRIQWPLAFAGSIQHDIAFGVVPSFEERPFYPASWVDISDQNKGLAYIHCGTGKHWVSGHTLVNLWAWGEDTDAIGNRMDINRWPKTFDQRLDGRHTIQYSIYPHAGDWRAGNVIQMARSVTRPPLPFIKAANSGGSLPPDLELLQLENADLIATAIKMENSDLLCRLYSVSRIPEPVRLRTSGLEIKEISTIAGEATGSFAPYKIGRILLKIG